MDQSQRKKLARLRKSLDHWIIHAKEDPSRALKQLRRRARVWVLFTASLIGLEHGHFERHCNELLYYYASTIHRNASIEFTVHYANVYVPVRSAQYPF